MRIACWITKATHTLSDYATLTAFPLQQWLQVRGSMSRYPYTACLVQYSHIWPDVRYRLKIQKNGLQFTTVNIKSIIGRCVCVFQFQICSQMSLRSSRPISDRSFNLFHFFHRLPFNIVRFRSPFSAASLYKAISRHSDFYNRRFCAVCGISLSIFPN